MKKVAQVMMITYAATHAGNRAVLSSERQGQLTITLLGQMPDILQRICPVRIEPHQACQQTLRQLHGKACMRSPYSAGCC